MSEIKDRTHGTFFGQLVGDAVGTRYEFMKSKQAIELLKSDTSNKTFLMFGGGPFNLPPGQYTDDSELALGVWYSILNLNKYDVDFIAETFYEWYKSDPFDIGRATRLAFCDDYIKKGLTPSKCMTASAKRNNAESLSNGCLMKISAIGAINALLNKEYDLKFLAKEICDLTNPNEICVDMSICYVVAIDTAIKTGNPIAAYNAAISVARLEITKLILADAKIKPTKTKLLQKRIQYEEFIEIDADGQFQGYIGIAFQNAFYHLINTTNNNALDGLSTGFARVMIETICLGGDVDTNACIAGALYGACFGNSCIPETWKATVIKFISNNERKSVYKPLDHQEIWKKLQK